ncbi:hypothetical protein DL96DRAFT_1816068 [Flagelloscypha sp. PMI_526]|nr:hypothetical protein DL96DRAFT_1816068 [Flagelloscypha sp. PMI_526]
MTFLRARTFIACLPLRSGIWILGLVGLVVAGFGAAGSAMLLMLLANHPVALIPKIALFVQTGSMGLFGLISLFGILTGILKTHGIAFIYSKIALLNVLVNIPALGYIVFATLRPIPGADVSAFLRIRHLRREGFSLGSHGLDHPGSVLWAEQLFEDSAAHVDRSLDFSDSEKGSIGDFTRDYAVSMPRFQDQTGQMYYR